MSRFSDLFQEPEPAPTPAPEPAKVEEVVVQKTAPVFKAPKKSFKLD